ncbi:MAG: hypothetical protein WB444_05540 [Gallionella sp.]
MTNKFRYLCLAVIPLFLVACIDTQNVTTFASSVLVVTSATSKITASDRTTCANINATLAEIQTLPKIKEMGDFGTANCTELDKTLKAIEGINTVLANYGQALNDISQSTFINYDSDVTSLKGVLNSLPAAQKPTQDQINAVSGLAGWIASLATEEKRDEAIKDAMEGNNGEMRDNFHKVVSLLKQLNDQYSEGLEINAKITQSSLNLVSHFYGNSEPLAVAEHSLRVAANTTVSADQEAAVKQYDKALDGMSNAFDAASKNQTTKELLTEVRDFAKQARTMYQSVSKAFPNS